MDKIEAKAMKLKEALIKISPGQNVSDNQLLQVQVFEFCHFILLLGSFILNENGATKDRKVDSG